MPYQAAPFVAWPRLNLVCHGTVYGAGLVKCADLLEVGMTPLEQAIRSLDNVQAEATILPEGCPEPWRQWIVEAHNAMCNVVQEYRREHWKI